MGVRVLVDVDCFTSLPAQCCFEGWEAFENGVGHRENVEAYLVVDGVGFVEDCVALEDERDELVEGLGREWRDVVDAQLPVLERLGERFVIPGEES